MNEPAHKLTFTFAEYVEQERASDTKHELVNGEIFAMAGGTIEHGRLASNVTISLGAQLRAIASNSITKARRVRGAETLDPSPPEGAGS
jgi:Uma2 family endonuclease